MSERFNSTRKLEKKKKKSSLKTVSLLSLFLDYFEVILPQTIAN